MGRLPKGFKKTLQHHKDEPEDGEGEGQEVKHPSTSRDDVKTDAHAQQASASKASAPAHHSPAGSDDEEEDDEGGPETRGKMLQRHKREMLAFKKNLQRMGKKSKDEIAKMTAEIEARHAKELKDVDAAAAQAPSTSKPAAAAADAAAEGVGALKMGAGEEDAGGHKTKAMKRREKLAAAEAEREARVAEELAAAGPSARQQEEEALHALLVPLGLAVRDIRADGHCLYRSIEDQLSLAGGTGGASSSMLDYLALRKAAAAHMRAHPQEYVHYLSEDDALGHATPEEALEAYCQELESTAAWGGQLELSVLAQVLKRQIRVYSVGLPPMTLGEDQPGPPLQVCYLRHAFGLGEHYNSLGPAGSGAATEHADS
mmetsp:Transcript_25187/g.63934  ORF Transcript_25187/g.63934 Transcript_25187/m.63934 type:complete len:372 (-) Transcript_25187:390-1505(-)|eukprot:CAMPEP_0202861736 /NCGR_PEP_ID=MMETSP1391-20130828/3036_1 /ASSEMBLY_ACC=CAM_ASM_000867 /TAXON_ID=1034604 /ORGANISM="Chlamydomonas leiostraca, Strain SAG 11-49" /LENGTH=371 /DNA_ID=CAMNT_0049541169 /DNA_START=45 /DNA_END=1160 /DNA_ORIENTATION=-